MAFVANKFISPRAFPPSQSRRLLIICQHCSYVTKFHQDDDNVEDVPLVRFRQDRPGYPAIDLSIQSASKGGHALLSRNGRGKSRLVQALLAENEAKRKNMDDIRDVLSTDAPISIQHVSFESHQELLQKGGTVYKTLAQGNLNKAAQFLVVRFGLFPLLHQDVRTLSNGQIKKVLLVRALSLRPKLLILDNAFDGLDVPSREVLKQLVSKTLQGFSADILVQGVSAKSTAHTQVLLLTHRAEEIVDEVSTFSYFERNSDENVATGDDTRNCSLITAWRHDNQSAANMLHRSLDMASDSDDDGSVMLLDDLLPEANAIQQWWLDGGQRSDDSPMVEPNQSRLVVDMENLSVERNNKILLESIDWKVQRGERWIVGGLNGAGKSTLSRLLARPEQEQQQGVLQGHWSILEDNYDGQNDHNVGWVSTELHMSLAHAGWTVRDIFRNKHSTASAKGTDLDLLANDGDHNDDDAAWYTVAEWLGVDSLVDERFDALSQGQQRMVLIAASLGLRPRLLVLDEPCQATDLVNRQRVLELVDLICQNTDMTLIYITHHLEETLPSITHALHLTEGRVVFKGLEAEYKPAELDEL